MSRSVFELKFVVIMSFLTKVVLLVFVLSIYCSLHGVHGKPQEKTFAKLAMAYVKNVGQCSSKAGCYEGKCWAYCGLSLTSFDWCYTTLTYSQSFSYVSCTTDAECKPCWLCASSCVYWF